MNVYRKTVVADCYGPLYELARVLPGVEYKGVVGRNELARAVSSAARKRREEQASFTRTNYAWPLRAKQWVDFLQTKIA